MDKVLVIGSLNMDYITTVDRRPLDGETVLGKSFIQSPGGKGANQAYALSKFGVQTAMIGMVGRDAAGNCLLENLRSVGVNIKGVKQSEKFQTGCAFIEVDGNGQNRIVVVQGANGQINEDHLLESEELFAWADIIVMQLEIPLETVAAASGLAEKYKKKVLLDPAPARNDLPSELLQRIDILKPNETELEILSGKKVKNKADVVSAAQILLKKGVRNVLVSLGEKGAAMINEASTFFVPAKAVQAVDTTAAGDCFTAAFVSELKNENYVQAIDFAVRAAAIAVTRRGAQSSIPAKQEVEEDGL